MDHEGYVISFVMKAVIGSLQRLIRPLIFFQSSNGEGIQKQSREGAVLQNAKDQEKVTEQETVDCGTCVYTFQGVNTFVTSGCIFIAWTTHP